MPRNVIKKYNPRRQVSENYKKLKCDQQLLKHIIRVLPTCYVEIGFSWVRPLCFSALHIHLTSMSSEEGSEEPELDTILKSILSSSNNTHYTIDGGWWCHALNLVWITIIIVSRSIHQLANKLDADHFKLTFH